ncbi:hypothetical protein OUZ56_018642 [Daphnia magna]|uniref:Uncharacterized protein n=1 Tax=Daphnia magna TaxID=35525 RepID=A0ABQ9Z9E2_9CRUS|nr:hypothetical protein OUZ56_018642 [Daphnia magna]
MSNFHQEEDGIDSDSTVINESPDAATNCQPSTSRNSSSEQESFSSSSVYRRKNRVDYVALTTDCWTSLNNYSYLTVTAHYINHKMKMMSRVLSTVHMENNHTAHP